jgi:hypothetical protein
VRALGRRGAEALGANLRFVVGSEVGADGRGDAVAERDGAPDVSLLPVLSSSSSMPKLSFGVPTLRFFFLGCGSVGVDVLYYECQPCPSFLIESFSAIAVRISQK